MFDKCHFLMLKILIWIVHWYNTAIDRVYVAASKHRKMWRWLSNLQKRVSAFWLVWGQKTICSDEIIVFGRQWSRNPAIAAQQQSQVKNMTIQSKISGLPEATVSHVSDYQVIWLGNFLVLNSQKAACLLTKLIPLHFARVPDHLQICFGIITNVWIYSRHIQMVTELEWRQ